MGLMVTEKLRLKSGGTSTELQGEILDGKLKICLQTKVHCQNNSASSKHKLLRHPLLQLFCSIRSMTLAGRDHNFESQ